MTWCACKIKSNDLSVLELYSATISQAGEDDKPSVSGFVAYGEVQVVTRGESKLKELSVGSVFHIGGRSSNQGSSRREFRIRKELVG